MFSFVFLVFFKIMHGVFLVFCVFSSNEPQDFFRSWYIEYINWYRYIDYLYSILKKFHFFPARFLSNARQVRILYLTPEVRRTQGVRWPQFQNRYCGIYLITHGCLREVQIHWVKKNYLFYFAFFAFHSCVNCCSKVASWYFNSLQ